MEGSNGERGIVSGGLCWAFKRASARVAGSISLSWKTKGANKKTALPRRRRTLFFDEVAVDDDIANVGPLFFEHAGVVKIDISIGKHGYLIDRFQIDLNLNVVFSRRQVVSEDQRLEEMPVRIGGYVKEGRIKRVLVVNLYP